MTDSPSTPRLVWRSRSTAYRLIVTTGGPLNPCAHISVESDQFAVLEVLEGKDALGNERWRLADLFGDQSAWRAAFHELAAECGLFGLGPAEISERVRQLLRSAEGM